jgi:hypothetical protein
LEGKVRGTNALTINMDTLKEALTEYLSTRIVPAPTIADVDLSKAAYESELTLKLVAPAKNDGGF